MCNPFSVSLMLHNLDCVKFEVSETKKDMFDNEYRVLDINKLQSVFLNEEEIRDLIDVLAKATYGKTWGELEDEKLFAEIDKEETEKDLKVALENMPKLGNVSNF